MIRWLLNLLSNTKSPEFDLYKPKERLIYRFWDGKDIVSCDPMELERALAKLGPDLEVCLKIANFPAMKGAEENYLESIDKIKGIFSVKGIREGGLTEPELFELLEDYLKFRLRLKKKLSKSLTLPKETLPPSTTSSNGSQPTQNTLDSGSIGKDSSTGKPIVQPLG